MRICDDEIDYVNSTADAVMKILSEYEVDISTYTSGIDLINNSTKRIDILFIDIEMPGLNGIETIRKLRVINPSIIVFILTNYTNYMTDVFRVGTFQFLKKPLRVDDLKYDLLRAVELYKTWNTIKLRLKKMTILGLLIFLRLDILRYIRRN